MFFKNKKNSFFQLALILSISIFIFSCSREDEAYNPVIKFQINSKAQAESSLKCLKDMGGTFTTYFKSQLSSEELDSFWNCILFSVQSYKYLVEGTKKNEHSMVEMSRFLEKWVYGGNNQLNPEVIKAIFQFKSAIIGGSVDNITNEELDKLSYFIHKILRGITQELLPHMKNLTSGTLQPVKEGITDKSMTESIYLLRKSLQQMGYFFQMSQKNYSFQKMSELMSSLKGSPPQSGSNKPSDESSGSFFKNAEKIVPVLRESKVLLVGPNRDYILSHEWPALFYSIGNIYGIWLRVVNFISPNKESLLSGEGFKQFDQIVNDVLSNIEEGLNRRGGKPYLQNEAEKLFAAMEPITGIPFGLDYKTLTAMWQLLVDKILVKTSGRAQAVEGLTLDKLTSLKNQFLSWRNIQYQVEGVDINHIDFNDKNWGTLGVLLSQIKNPLDLDPQNILHIGQKDPQFSKTSLRYLNLEQALFSPLIKAYSADDKNQAPVGLKKEEVDQIFIDLKPFIEKLGFSADSADRLIKVVFRDANIFMPNSDGNTQLGLLESMEFSHYLISSMSLSKMLVNEAVQACLDGVSVKDGEISLDCLKQVLASNGFSLFSNLPQMQTYLSKMSPQIWNEYFEVLQLAINPDRRKGIIRFSKVTDLFMLQQYVETLFTIYDNNGDQEFNSEESLYFLDQKYEIILQTLKTLNVPSLNKSIVNSVFTYMLKYGRSPTDINSTDKLKDLRFDNWQKQYAQKGAKGWDISADRLSVLRLIAMLVGE